MKFSTHCDTETTKMKFVYFVEDLIATLIYRYGTIVSNVLNGFSRTAVSQRLQPLLSVSRLHKIKSVKCEFLGKCYGTVGSNSSRNFIFYFTVLLTFLSSLIYIFFLLLNKRNVILIKISLNSSTDYFHFVLQFCHFLNPIAVYLLSLPDSTALARLVYS